MEQNAKTVADYIDLARRRKHLILLVFTLISALSVIVAYSLPRIFRSTATLLMEAPIPKDLIPAMAAEYANEQVNSLVQKVMTTDNVLAIIESSNLYEEDMADNRLPKYHLAELFKRNTEVNLVKSNLGGLEVPGKTEIAFTISFNHEDPDKAREIADRLASLFIEQNDQERTRRAVRAADFLAGESEKLNHYIRTLDDRISDYKKRYNDSLPEQLQGNLSALDRKEDELRETEHQLRVTQERITFLAVELARAQAELPAGVNDKTPLTKAGELRLRRAEYLRLSSKYYPSHPDVVRVKRQIEALERQLENPEPQSEPGEETAVRTNHPALLGVQAQYNASLGELESLRQNKALLKTEIDRLQQRITLAPEVEKGYMELVRERDHALNKYNQLKEKVLDARLVQTLEEEQHGQTLTLIDQPTVPLRPEKAVRRKVTVAGMFLGLAAGLGVALLMEFLDPRVRGYRAVSDITGLLPLVVIPYIESPSEVEERLAKQRHRRKTAILAGTACMVAAVIVVCIIFLPFGQAGIKLAEVLGRF
jgi:succinoglycan biosynthesis transport protein ExoP